MQQTAKAVHTVTMKHDMECRKQDSADKARNQLCRNLRTDWTVFDREVVQVSAGVEEDFEPRSAGPQKLARAR
jgi:hypothetical protein